MRDHRSNQAGASQSWQPRAGLWREPLRQSGESQLVRSTSGLEYRRSSPLKPDIICDKSKDNGVIKVKLFRLAIFLVAILAFAAHVAAQSPNTATMIVTVVDQTGAVVKNAKISVTNIATGAVREGVSGDEGTATFAALSLTGEYKVTVNMAGFTAEDVTGLTLH